MISIQKTGYFSILLAFTFVLNAFGDARSDLEEAIEKHTGVTLEGNLSLSEMIKIDSAYRDHKRTSMFFYESLGTRKLSEEELQSAKSWLGPTKSWLEGKTDIDASSDLKGIYQDLLEKVSGLEEDMFPIGAEDLVHLSSDNRLETGILLDELTVESAKGSLIVKNGRKSDAYVKVVFKGEARHASYIRSGGTLSITAIPDGSYTLFFGTGFGWDAEQQRFTRGKQAFKFDRDLSYKTTQSGGMVYYSQQTITLYPVAGGNATTSEVPIDEFDNY